MPVTALEDMSDKPLQSPFDNVLVDILNIWNCTVSLFISLSHTETTCKLGYQLPIHGAWMSSAFERCRTGDNSTSGPQTQRK